MSFRPSPDVTLALRHLSVTPSLTMSSSSLSVVRTWTANAEPWTAAVRSRSIGSREVTDASIVEAVLSGLPPAGRVLDMGCGEGWLVRALEVLGAVVRGVDASHALIEKAAQASASDFEVLLYDDAIQDPARLGGPYDAIVFNFSLLSDAISDTLAAASTRLEDGGRIVIQTVHPFSSAAGSYIDGWRTETFESIGHGFEPMPWYFRTVSTWIRALAAARLTIVEMREPEAQDGGLPASLIIIAVPEGPSY